MRSALANKEHAVESYASILFKKWRSAFPETKGKAPIDISGTECH